MLKKSKNGENSSSAKMAELVPPNGRNLTLPKGGTRTSQMAEHTYNHNINNHNIKNLNLSQSVSDFQQSSVESFQQNTVENYDGQTDGYIPKKENFMSYREMLVTIGSPLEDPVFDMYEELTEETFEPYHIWRQCGQKAAKVRLDSGKGSDKSRAAAVFVGSPSIIRITTKL